MAGLRIGAATSDATKVYLGTGVYNKVYQGTSLIWQAAAGGGLLLDGITSTTLSSAFSLRKLRTSYSGSCLRMRRTSDSVEEDFGFANNVLDTAAVATFLGGSAGAVVTWYDQSGNGHNATMATTGSQPSWDTTTLSKPTLTFNGSSSHLISNLTTGFKDYSAGRTHIGVLKKANTFSSTYDWYTMRSDSNYYFNSRTEGGVYTGIFKRASTSSAKAQTTNVDAGNAHTITASWTNGSTTVKAQRKEGAVMGTAVSTTTSQTGASTADWCSIGNSSHSNHATKLQYWPGQIQEIIDFAGDLPDADRNTITSNQLAYYF